MFSEYASKFLSRSQRPPAPLFDGSISASAVYTDTDGFLGPLNDSLASTAEYSDQSHINTDSEAEENDPPLDIAIEQPTTSLWASNVQQWQRATRSINPKHKNRSSMDTNRIPGPSSEGYGANTTGGAAANNGSNSSPDQVTATQGPSGEDRGRTWLGSALDNIVGGIYITSMAVSLATASITVLSTSPDDNGSPVYPVFAYMVRPLAVYSLLSIVVAAAWLYSMMRQPRAMVQISTISVPIILLAICLYSILMSVHSPPSRLGHGWAHGAMRLTAVVPLVLAVLWVVCLRASRRSAGKATEMIALSVEVLNSCPSAIGLTIGVSMFALLCSSVWCLFISRAFLEGSLSVILVVWFSFMYLWTWRMSCALHRTALAGIASQWYNNQKPRMTSVVHNITTVHFGSGCLASLLELIVRIPLLILPSRPANWLTSVLAFGFSSSAPVTKLLNPLTLPTAVIRRVSLHDAAQLVALHSGFRLFDKHAYRVAKLILTAARACCALVVGLLAWVHADRYNDASSVYGYMVAVVALFIGWTVVGTCENTLSMTLDALAACYALDSASQRHDIDRVFALPETQDV